LLRRVLLVSALILAIGYLLEEEAVDFWQDEVEDFERLQDGNFAVDVKAHNLAEKQKIGMLLFGDSGDGSKAQYDVATGMWQLCERLSCGLALGLGDNIYPSGVTSVSDPQWQSKFDSPYRKFVQSAQRDFWMLVGNHDRRGSVAAQIHYSQQSPIWRMPARDYAIPRLPRWLNVYVLDTTFIAPGADIPHFQNAFEKNFEDQLKRASAHLCKRPGWRVIATHHPVVSTGARNNVFREDNLFAALSPFIEECGIHLVVSGHEHLQQHLEMDGVEYLIQGAASHTRPRVKPLQHHTAISRYLGYEPGFAHLTFTQEKLEIRFNDSLGKSLYSSTIGLASFADRKKQAAIRFD
jgi:tartrate-resistant acid phosphatase type 5